jgi:glutaminyl-tRNA synthetase
MAVLKPLKLIIDNWPAGKGESKTFVEQVEAVNNPEDESAGSRKIPFSGELMIEREDFEEVPPPKYFRLYPGNSVRLRYGYIVTCTGCDKDSSGNVTAVHCTYDPETKGGNANAGKAGGDNKKVKSTIHWVSAPHAVPIEVRIYDYLFSVDKPMDVEPGKSFLGNLNQNSLEVINTAWAEPCLVDAKAEERFQFERLGYFVKDIASKTGADNSAGGKPVFNKTVGLRDTWAKIINKK